MKKLPPESGAIVMGTGIVSVALFLDRQRTLSEIVLVLTAVAWTGLAAVASWRLVRGPRSFLEAAGSPGSLTAVAATAVLGSRVALLGWRIEASVLLAIALVTWLALLIVLERAIADGAGLPRTGATFMLVVAPQSLAALAGALAASWQQRWLFVLAVLGALIGVLIYPSAAKKFELRKLLVGAGEHWVAGGALAISALSAAELTLAAERLHGSETLVSALKGAAAVLWTAAFLWLPGLLAGELIRPRLHFGFSRWSTVFPLGMYAACSFEVAAIASVGALRSFARAWVWIAVAVWLTVLGATIRAYGGSLSRGRD